jgi:hypothetical protein
VAARFFFHGHFPGRIDFSAQSSTAGHKGVPYLAPPLPSSRSEGRLVAFKRQKPPKWDQKEGQKGPRPVEKIPKNTIFQNPIQKIPFQKILRGSRRFERTPRRNYLFLDRAFPQWCSMLRARPVKGHTTPIFLVSVYVSE